MNALIWSAPFFQVSSGLVDRLRAALEAKGWPTTGLAGHRDCFLLDAGLGPAVYLCSSGHVVWEDDGCGVIPTRGKAFASIVVGAHKTGVTELLALLPRRPEDAQDCGACNGSGWLSFAVSPDEGPHAAKGCVCLDCGGLGWLSDEIDLSTESV